MPVEPGVVAGPLVGVDHGRIGAAGILERVDHDGSLAPIRARARQDSGIPVLLLLNGPPGVGKSTLARRYADGRPGTLLVEIDEVRSALPAWQEDPSTKVVARELALAAAAAHLATGRDVVVPQYLGRPDTVAEVEALAAASEAAFVHVVLTAPHEVLVGRFRRRRDALARDGIDNPEADLPDAEVEAAIDDAQERLGAMAWRRGAVVVPAGGDADDSYRALVVALADP